MRAPVLAGCLSLLPLLGCRATPGAVAPTGHAWPEADALFHQDPRWLGGDDAASVDLGDSRVLWLFGDSFIATSETHRRSEAAFVRNSVAIETGYDPSHATMAFRWGTSNGAPAPFFSGIGNDWYWPGHGAMVGGSLVLFLSRIRSSTGGLGFQAAGWTAVRIDDPRDDPAQWQITPLATPSSTLGVTFGEAALVQGECLLAYGADDRSHAVRLVRWPTTAVARGDLSAPEWWTPAGWVAQDALKAAPGTLFSDGATELSVQADPRGAGWVEVQTVGFGAATLEIRFATELSGPWGALGRFYTPPESSRPNTLIYAGKAHPELLGAPIIATYASNSSVLSTLVNDPSLYYPRFVRASW